MSSPFVEGPGGGLATETQFDPFLALAVDEVFQVGRIGVQFPDSPAGKVYVYEGLPGVAVDSLVLVPANAFRPTPSEAICVTLDPPPYNGPVKQILAVLS
jgi:hypothetical protein